jgi:hypothetical protein
MHISKTWWPTNKWWAATITAAGGLLVTWVSVGAWSKALTAATLTLVTQRVVAYLVPSDAPAPAAERTTTTTVAPASG